MLCKLFYWVTIQGVSSQHIHCFSKISSDYEHHCVTETFFFSRKTMNMLMGHLVLPLSTSTFYIRKTTTFPEGIWSSTSNNQLFLSGLRAKHNWCVFSGSYSYHMTDSKALWCLDLLPATTNHNFYLTTANCNPYIHTVVYFWRK